MKNKIDKQALREKIQGLQGLSNDDKSQLLTLLAEQKKYGLVWEDSTEEAEELLRDNIPMLREVKDKAILHHSPMGETEGAPNHILIEGDNLHALTALTYTHEGKIDVIYIDPPYNTGNKDFVYNDSFVESEDSYRHSKWLSFMEKRLRIAKRLLSNKGVIFISIDDNEQANLKLLCDEVFTNQNCLATLIWDLGSGTSAGHFTRSHEYVLVYANKRSNIPNFTGGDGIIDDRAIKKKSAKNAESEYFFSAGTKCEATDGFELKGEWGESEKTRLVSGRFVCKNGALAENVTLAACWTQRNQMDSFFAGKPTVDSKGQKVIEFYFRDNGKLYCRKERDKINPPTVLREIGSTKQGTSKLKELFNDELPFDFAKPISLISFLLKLRSTNAVILDFFAGSGTTLHATMQLNSEDGGHRQCILVTNNENNICESVTYERNKRVIEGYTTPKGQEVPGLTNNNLRYYQMDMLPHDGSHQSRKEIAHAMTDLLCIKEGIYDEQDMFGSLSLQGKSKMLRHFAEGDKRMLLIYDSRVIPFIVKEIKNMEKSANGIKIYIFADGSYPYTADFEGVLDKVTLVAMPYAMDKALKLVLPAQTDKELEVEPENTDQDA